MGRFAGRTALVTGGTTGIGYAIAARLVAEGARVVITGRDDRLGMEAAERLGGAVRFVRADATQAEEVDRSVREAVTVLGGLDVLVNNAGRGVAARTIETPVEDFDRVMAVNVRGAFLYARAAFPHLIERRGCIVTIASDAGVLGEAEVGVYSVSKAAVIMLSKMLALDGGPYGVRSNCVCPGDIRPGMRHMAPPGEEFGQEDADAWLIPPIGRIGEPEDVASVVAFLAGEESAFVTGAVVLVDGGMRAGARTGTKPESETPRRG